MTYCYFKTDEWQQVAKEYDATRDVQGIFSAPRRVIATGDIHSDFQLLYTLLVDVARVIRPIQHQRCQCRISHDSEQRAPHKLLYIRDTLPACTFEWCAPDNTWIVFLGDFLDRKRAEYTATFSREAQFDGEMYQEEVHVLDFVNYVAVLAHQRKNGGKVIKLVGNHELMNLSNGRLNTDYMTNQAIYDIGLLQMEKEAHQGQVENPSFENCLLARERAFGLHGFMREKLMCMGCYAIVQIGPAFFMHGGLNTQLSTHPAFTFLLDPAHVQVKAQSTLKQAVPHFSTVGQINGLLWQWLSHENETNEATEAFFESEHGICWDRSLASEESKTPSLSAWTSIFHSVIRGHIDPLHNIVVVGHCIQSARCCNPSAEPTYRFQHLVACKADNQDQDAQPWILKGPALLTGEGSRGMIGSSTNNNSRGAAIPRPWCGIQFRKISSGIKEASAASGHIYMCDCGSSRAFDTANDLEQEHKEGAFEFTCRAPQVLVFDCWNKTTPWLPEVWVSKYHLPRRWLAHHHCAVDLFRDIC